VSDGISTVTVKTDIVCAEAKAKLNIISRKIDFKVAIAI
jgi:hypothetical protein